MIQSILILTCTFAGCYIILRDQEKEYQREINAL